MGKWLKLEDNMRKIIIELEYKDGNKVSHEYYTVEGDREYNNFMNNPNIYFGRMIEVYNNGEQVCRASFCNG